MKKQRQNMDWVLTFQTLWMPFSLCDPFNSYEVANFYYYWGVHKINTQHQKPNNYCHGNLNLDSDIQQCILLSATYYHFEYPFCHLTGINVAFFFFFSPQILNLTEAEPFQEPNRQEFNFVSHHDKAIYQRICLFIGSNQNIVYFRCMVLGS